MTRTYARHCFINNKMWEDDLFPGEKYDVRWADPVSGEPHRHEMTFINFLEKDKARFLWEYTLGGQGYEKNIILTPAQNPVIEWLYLEYDFAEDLSSDVAWRMFGLLRRNFMLEPVAVGNPQNTVEGLMKGWRPCVYLRQNGLSAYGVLEKGMIPR